MKPYKDTMPLYYRSEHPAVLPVAHLIALVTALGFLLEAPLPLYILMYFPMSLAAALVHVTHQFTTNHKTRKCLSLAIQFTSFTILLSGLIKIIPDLLATFSSNAQPPDHTIITLLELTAGGAFAVTHMLWIRVAWLHTAKLTNPADA